MTAELNRRDLAESASCSGRCRGCRHCASRVRPAGFRRSQVR